ncbi:unnamed protein product [Closterium sp. Naga37s-1]|nr:unnamed protein product [Closterium sp. Naga37s-1]
MATLVPTSEEEPTLVVARFCAEIAWAEGGEEVAGPAVAQAVAEAGMLLAANRNADLVSLLLTSAETVLAKGSEKDVEGAFTFIASLIPKADSKEQVEALASQLASKLLMAPADKPALKLKILVFLYNALVACPRARYVVFAAALRLALAAKQHELMLPLARRFSAACFREWGGAVDKEELKELYLSLGALLQDTKGGAKDASAFTNKYLSLFTAAEAASSPAAQQAAAQAAIDFIRTPDAFQSDLLDLPAVHHLASVPEHAPLHALLCVFLKERLPQFHAFVQANPTALETYGLSHDECEAKMRLLSLAVLASDSFAAAASAAAAASGTSAAGSAASPTAAAGGSGAATAGGGAFAVGEIRYALLQDTLQVAEEEVEQWVVRAIAAKVVDARMDQQRRVVVVTRSTQRVFGLPQWLELRNRLAMWKENISNVSRVAQSARLACLSVSSYTPSSPSYHSGSPFSEAAMAKSKNHTAHNQTYKQHKNGIKKPKKHRYSSTLGMDAKFVRNMRYSRKGNVHNKKGEE